jgi:hypothetical protein
MIVWGRKIPARIFGRFWIPVTAALALLLLSCPTGLEDDSGRETVLDTRAFWAQNISNENYYQTTADLLVEGRYCKIWVEQAAKERVDSVAAQTIADVYDNTIYPRMIKAFSIGPIYEEGSGALIANNIMELADWLTDKDGKLTILLLDIQDGSTRETGYVGGYFWSGNFFKKDPGSWSRNSNEIDMIYVDTDPGKPGEPESNITLAHEMQHLMNFITSLLTRRSASSVYLMDVWIDEGLSSVAEYIYLDGHVPERYLWFKEDPQGTIARGNNFFVWGNYQDDSVLDDYATVYLFFQWLRLQSGGDTGIYKKIISSNDYNYRAVTGTADSAMPGMGYSDWGTLLKTWMAANYINAPSGPYGYRNDPALNTVQAKTAPAGTTSLPLLPGEGVYSRTEPDDNTSSYTPGSGSHIKYAGLDKATGTVSDTETFAGGALLTYNTNTDLEGQNETGRLTGVMMETGVTQSGGGAGSRSIGDSAREYPIRIDARDMLARNGHPGKDGFDWGALPLSVKASAGETHEK